MKINTGSVKPISPNGVQDVGNRNPAPQSSASLQPTRDKVAINSVASQLQQLELALNDVSVVDTARVDAIKQAISDGHFKVNSDVVADKLLASVREHLFNKKV
ncbi:MAG: flagellar biosynthesis anti-sigma factor FlgM [Burkholderiales bacterium]